ncbi:cationic amino acid transporter 4-like isoform X2 [Diceros bicornis minor]|uniref:cationic amino acid transporter 4-like isoform X2 n=1 Tax=Diceros bicornis minor TaxID=77932 RepID=UPI0026EA27FC|nr:cationic amino acid transporter 4-like isoform X2 [Diceros bicornis minor]
MHPEPIRCRQLAWCSSQLPTMAWGLPSTAGLVRFCQKLNRLKTVEETTRETSLRRHLTTLDLTLLGVGTMMGFGLYVLMGTVAKEMAGPAVVVSFTVAAVAFLLAALCYTEFGTRASGRDCAYLFTYVSMGELWAFLIGWIVLLRCLIAGAAMAHTWSGHLDVIFSHRIHSFTEAHVGIWQVPFLAQYPDFLAAAILLLISTFVPCGAHVSSWLRRTFSAINLVIVLFIIILGCVLARPHNWSAEEGGFAPFSFSGIMAGTATCFYTFVGFGVIVGSSEEARNPQRAVPIAIVISLGLAAGTYILASTVLTLMVPWHSLDPDSALADAFYQRGYSWAGVIVAAGAICGMTTVLISNLFSLQRMVHAMAVDGLIFQVFAHVHPRIQVSVVGILVFGVLMALLALLLDLEALVQFLSFGVLLTYTFMATSIMVLRFQKCPPSSSSGPASPGSVAREYDDSSGHTELVGTEQASAPEPGQLRPALRSYLGFLGGCRPGATVAWALGVLVASAITLDCVLVFGDSALHLPLWGYTLLLLLSSVMFLLSLLVLGAHHQQRRQDTFQVPLVPLTPALSILLNIFLMLHLSSLTWLCFSIWLLIGLCHPCRTRGVFWLRHPAQQGEPAGAAEVDCHTRQPGGDGAGPAAPQSDTGPGSWPHGAACQSMRTAGGLPALPHWLAASSIQGGSCFQGCQCRGLLRTLAQVPSFESLGVGFGQRWCGGLFARRLPVYDQLQLPGQVE